MDEVGLPYFLGWFQYRYALIVLSFFGLALVYGMRVSFNVALVGMVNQSAIAKGVQTGMCPKLQDSLVTTVNLQNESETYRTQHQVEEKKVTVRFYVITDIPLLTYP